MTILGIDVSSEQGRINWEKVSAWRGARGERIEFAIVKATTGNGGVDPHLIDNARGADIVGLLVGFYHFADPDGWHANDPVDEADHFVACAQTAGWRSGEHLLALDIEKSRLIYNTGKSFRDWVATFLSRVEERTGQRAWVYTGGSFFDPKMGGIKEPSFALCPLWLAAYVRKEDVFRYVPKMWAAVGFALWQRSGDLAASDCSVLRVDGISTNVDRDEFDGTLDELRARIAAGVLAPSVPALVDDVAVQTNAASTIADEIHDMSWPRVDR